MSDSQPASLGGDRPPGDRPRRQPTPAPNIASDDSTLFDGEENLATVVSRELGHMAYQMVAQWEATVVAVKDAELALLRQELEKNVAQLPPVYRHRLSASLASLEAFQCQCQGARSRAGTDTEMARGPLQRSATGAFSTPMAQEATIASTTFAWNLEGEAPSTPTRIGVGTSLLPMASAEGSKAFSLGFMNSEKEYSKINVKFRPELHATLYDHLKGRVSSLRGHVAAVSSAELRQPSALGSSASTRYRRWMIRPDSNLRFWFEVLCTLALIHDSLAIPFILAWDIALGALMVTSIMSLLIWSADICMNFTTGFFKRGGEIEMNPSLIAKHYLRTWFLVDLVTVCSDWLSLGLVLASAAGDKSDVSVARAVRLARIVRATRVVVLIRVVRNSSRALGFGRFTLSNTGQALTQVAKILLCILWVNHVFCCIWYGIGRAVQAGVLKPETQQSWLDLPVAGGASDFAHVGVPFQYTTAMHWSITQMTPGSMEVFPQNSFERAYNICLLVFGLLFGTTLVGQISSKMVQFNMSRQVEFRRTEELRRFLRENNVSTPLALRVQKQSADRMQDKSRLSEQDVEDIRYLSGNLRMQLRQEVFTPHIVRHPLFSAYAARDASSLKDLTSSGRVCYECLAAGHDLFSPKFAIDKAFLFLRGQATYAYSEDEADTDDEDPKSDHRPSRQSVTAQISAENRSLEIVPGVWLCEVALWMEWKALGHLEAIRPAEFMSVHTDAIVEMLKHHPKTAEMTVAWCQALHHQFLSDSEMDWGDLDFEINHDHSDILFRCPEEWRIFIGNQSLSMLEARHGLMFGRAKGMKDLREELNQGKCVIGCEGSGDIMRTVPLAALLLKRTSDFKILAEIASKRPGHGWRPDCKLPGRKLHIGDTPQEAAKALLEEELKVLVGSNVQVEIIAREKTVKESLSYGVKSMYLKTVLQGYVEPKAPPAAPGSSGAITPALSKVSSQAASASSRGTPHRARQRVLPPLTKMKSEAHTGHQPSTRLWSFDLDFVEDWTGKLQMYAWVTDSELKKLQEGLLDDEIMRLDGNAHSVFRTTSMLTSESNRQPSSSQALSTPPRTNSDIDKQGSLLIGNHLSLAGSSSSGPKFVGAERSHRSHQSSTESSRWRAEVESHRASSGPSPGLIVETDTEQLENPDAKISGL